MNQKKNVLINFIWRFAERCGAQVVQFVVSIVLARLLAPSLYGTIALVTVITNILQVFVDSGMGNALIQKKDADDLDFSTVFFFNFTVCSLLYLLMFFGAPAIAAFYQKPELVAVIRVLSLTLVISGLKNVQQAYVARSMQFKKFFFATLGGTLFAAVLGIILAVRGYGVWALVAQQLVNITIDTCVLWLTVHWRPKLMFSFERLKTLFSFGWKLLVSSLLDSTYENFRMLLIGKVYTEADLAFFNRGRQFPNLIIQNINTSIDSVLLPSMSKEQNHIDRVKSMTRRAIKTSTYIIIPFMVGLIVCAVPLIHLILNDQWMDSVPYMRIFALAYITYPIHTANLNAMKALGRSDLFLKLEIIKKVMGLSIIMLTLRHGTLILACSLLIECAISLYINSWPNKELLGYSFLDQMKDILPTVLLASVMGLCIWPVLLLHLSDFVTLLIMVPAGVVIYLAGSILFKVEAFQNIWGMLSPYVLKVLKRSQNNSIVRYD
ncbi:MAG: lipopolysaccharide biosynthesis protein [Dorea sp.]|nr:lipopolysaccharide biosynthesis protein [Dorea sp.]